MVVINVVAAAAVGDVWNPEQTMRRPALEKPGAVTATTSSSQLLTVGTFHRCLGRRQTPPRAVRAIERANASWPLRAGPIGATPRDGKHHVLQSNAVETVRSLYFATLGHSAQ